MTRFDYALGMVDSFCSPFCAQQNAVISPISPTGHKAPPLVRLRVGALVKLKLKKDLSC